MTEARRAWTGGCLRGRIAPAVLTGWVCLSGCASSSSVRPGAAHGPVFGAATFAVIPLETSDSELRSVATSELREQIARTRRFTMVEEDRIADVMRTIATSQQRDYAAALQAGNLLAARYVCFGSLETWSASMSLEKHIRLTAYARLTVRVVQVESGTILFEENTTEAEMGWSNDAPMGVLYASATSRAARELVRRFGNTFRLEGVVVQADGKRVLIDLGRSHGLEEGTTLEVFRRGTSVTHPVTGEGLEEPASLIGELKIVEAGESTSWAKVSKGRGVQVGDRIQSKAKKKSTWEW